jgi:hypothetical protein
MSRQTSVRTIGQTDKSLSIDDVDKKGSHVTAENDKNNADQTDASAPSDSSGANAEGTDAAHASGANGQSTPPVHKSAIEGDAAERDPNQDGNHHVDTTSQSTSTAAEKSGGSNARVGGEGCDKRSLYSNDVAAAKIGMQVFICVLVCLFTVTFVVTFVLVIAWTVLTVLGVDSVDSLRSGQC